MSTPGEILTQQFQDDKEALRMKINMEGTAMTNQASVDFGTRKEQFSALIVDFNKLQVNPVSGSYEFSVARAAMCTAFQLSQEQHKVNLKRELARLEQKYVQEREELQASYLQAITATMRAQIEMDRDEPQDGCLQAEIEMDRH